MRVHVPTVSVKIGRDVRGFDPLSLICPDDVSTSQNGIRFFLDGALVGIWRALRAHRVVGVLRDNPDAVGIEPSWDGSFIKVSESAASWAETQSNAGFYVCTPLLLAFDSDQPRYLVRSRDASICGGNAFALLLGPGQASTVRTLANTPESGG